MSSPLIWATYFAYQEYIAATFCVNKQLPLCNGKCFINTVVEEEQKPVIPKIEIRTPEIIPAVLEQNSIQFPTHVRTNHFHPHYIPSILHGIRHPLLKPPKYPLSYIASL
ncbi:MAG: hypothetical protein ACOYNS_13430 [Bacteroidota bacterium]